MSYSIYASLNIDLLKNTDVIVQLAYRSNVFSKGALEDLLVHVNKIVFLANLYMIGMKDEINIISTNHF